MLCSWLISLDMDWIFGHLKSPVKIFQKTKLHFHSVFLTLMHCEYPLNTLGICRSNFTWSGMNTSLWWLMLVFASKV